jgi:predicted CXXCH cytochrome family protein
LKRKCIKISSSSCFLFIKWQFIFFLFSQNILISCNSYTSDFVPIKSIVKHQNGMNYIGMDACLKCHPQIVSSHLQTSHYKTSKLIEFNDVDFSGKNSINFANGDSIKFTYKEGVFYQEGYRNYISVPYYKKRMDVVLGSGNKGKSFLNWDDNSLFQLQGSFLENPSLWVNSPGYPSSLSQMRPIFPVCLECHVTYAEPPPPMSKNQNNRFSKKNIIYGIDCQRCHGAVENHVKHHQENRMDTIGKYVLSYAKFTQSQRISMCALCHSGIGGKNETKPFSFQPGDSLKNLINKKNSFNSSKAIDIDVHANQVGLLIASKCFQETENMDCMTCHNPHKQERGVGIKFNAICISCHQNVKHSEQTSNNTISLSKCITCHMPLKNSKAMKLELDVNVLTPVKVRSHFISINDSHKTTTSP